MKKSKQGVYRYSMLLRSLAGILLPVLLGSSQITFANNTTNASKSHIIHLVYSSDSMLQSNIAKNISTHLTNKKPGSHITHLSPLQLNTVSQIKPDFVIAIGTENIRYTVNNFSKTNALLIASSPGEYNEAQQTKSKNAVLYMSQPYCKQIHLIKEINRQWRTVSYLSSKEKPVDSEAIAQCAERYDMDSYEVSTTDDGSTPSDIKKALSNSDLILALPDKTIYNGNSVKNILLTSYRSRKPVIGFSKNFVTAGALAAIYSNADQIAHSAIRLIDQYYSQKKYFDQKINYPQSFDISINRQVFRALNLKIPDTERLKRNLHDGKFIRSGAHQ